MDNLALCFFITLPRIQLASDTDPNWMVRSRLDRPKDEEFSLPPSQLFVMARVSKVIFFIDPFLGARRNDDDDIGLEITYLFGSEGTVSDGEREERENGSMDVRGDTIIQISV
jgi:hypothetical protein